MSLLEEACEDLRRSLRWNPKFPDASVDDTVSAWRAADHRDLFADLCAEAGTPCKPVLLWLWYSRGHLGDDQLPGYVAPFWCEVEKPQQLLPSDKWVELFRRAQYEHDLETPLVLFRGAAPSFKAGMAWTRRPEGAETFVARPMVEEGSCIWVYRTVVREREAILCDMDMQGVSRDEGEVVLDPSFLGRIEEYRLYDESDLPMLGAKFGPRRRGE